MNRRKFAALAGGAVAAWPLAALAQQPAGRVNRIGWLDVGAAETIELMAFQRGLRELGYVEGRNIVVEYRFADGKFERLSDLASELVRLKVDVIVPRGRAAVLAAKAATTTVPIVFITNDPVGSGLVASLARPGGNLTGISLFVPELIPKRLELLKEALKTVSRVGVLENPADPNTALFHSREFEEAARSLGVQLIVVAVRGTDDVADAFSAMAQARAGAAMVLGGAPFFDQRRRIVDLALNHRLPLAAEVKEYTAAGGFMSYGVSITALNRQVTTYVDKVLKGANPADLPVEQPTKFELVVNLKTAKALGLTIPPAILVRADEVIE